MTVTRSNYSGVQALRFFAAVAVVVSHAAGYVNRALGQKLPEFAFLGHLGVCLFFAISGFVMILSVDRDPAPSAVTFSLRRVCRVVPLYWLMTSVKLGTLLVGASVTVTTAVSTSAVIRSYLFLPTHNAEGRLEPLWTVGWTLVFEMAFYALVALALALRVDPVRFTTPVLIVVACSALIRPAEGPAVWFFANTIVLYFAAGMAIARFVRHRSSWLLAAQLVGLAVVATVVSNVRQAATGSSTVDVTPMAVVLGVAAVLLVTVVTEDRVGVRTPRWLVALGVASYALYLTHPLFGPAVPTALRLLGLSGAPVLVAVLVTVAVPVALSPLVSRFIERPLSRLAGRTLLRERTAPRLTPGRPGRRANAAARRPGHPRATTRR